MATAVAQWTWNTGPLDAALLRAFVPSVRAAQAEAKATAPTHKAGATVKRINASSIKMAQATLAPTGLGTVFEVGRTGGYPINPGGVKGLRRSRSRFALYDEAGRGYTVRGTSKTRRAQTQALLVSSGPLRGRYFSNVTGGSMKADPYIHPASVAWSQVIYPQFATRTLAAAGFSAVNIGSHL
jgi:hypothetical protein